MSSIRALKKLFIPGLSREFAWWLLLGGFVFSLVMAALSIAFSYADREAEVRRSVADTVDKSLLSISMSVYTIDADQLKTQLDSLLFNPNIEFVQVTELRAGKKIYTSRGVMPEGYNFIEERPLSYKVSSRLRSDYGQLTVIATLDATYNEMLRRAATVFLSNMLLALFLSVLLAQLLQRKLLRHIEKLAGLHTDLCVDNLLQRFDLDRSGSGLNRPDELDQLLVSVNIARRQFYTEISEANLQAAEADSEVSNLSHRVWDAESLERILDTAVARSQVMKDPFVLMLFKVNNEFDDRSEHVAQQFLHVVAKRCFSAVLQSRRIANVDENNVRLAAFGRNQFAIVINKIANPVHCKSLAERLLVLLQENIIIGARTIKPELSIGISLNGHGGRSQQSVLVAAEYALNIAVQKAPENAFEIYSE